jgi:hypothetical protein
MSISVGSGMPKTPVYVCPPRDSDPSVARRFGATQGKTHASDPDSDDPRQREFARHIVRHARAAGGVGTRLCPLGLYRRGRCSARPAPHGHDLPIEGRRGTHARPVEYAFFVLEACLTVGCRGLGGGGAYGRRAPRLEGFDFQPTAHLLATGDITADFARLPAGLPVQLIVGEADVITPPAVN